MKYKSRQSYQMHKGAPEDFDVTVEFDKAAFARLLGARLYTRDASRIYNLSGIVSATIKKVPTDAV